MSRTGPGRAYRQAIGRAVKRARAANEPWKRIEQWFAYKRTRLYQFMREAEAAEAKTADQDKKRRRAFTFSVHEHRACGQGAVARVLSGRS